MSRWKDIYQTAEKIGQTLLHRMTNEISDEPETDKGSEKRFSDAYLSERLKIQAQYDAGKAFRKLQGRRRRLQIGRYSVAASLLLLLSLSFWLVRKQASSPSAINVVVAVSEEIHPGERKAVLTLANGPVVDLRDSLLTANDLEKCLQEARPEKLPENRQRTKPEIAYHTLYVPRGGEFFLTLSDSTKVWLNSDTELRFPAEFAGDVRMVHLKGEAYFEVSHRAEHPFLVEMESSKVQVLGTSFNLRTYEDEKEIAATLVEGKVCFLAEGKEKLNLLPGEQAVLDDEGHLSKHEVDPYFYIAWKDGNFIFRKQPLEEVMQIIARWYDVEVHFMDDSLKKLSFSGNVKRYDDFSKIVQMLEMTGNTKFEIRGKNIFIKER